MLLASPRSLVVKPTHQTQIRLVFCWCSDHDLRNIAILFVIRVCVSIRCRWFFISEHSEQFLVSSERSARNATTVSSKVSDLVNSGDVSISISDVGSNSKLSEHGVSICEKGTAPGFKLLASGVDEPLVSSGVSSWKDLVLLLVCTPATCDDEAPGVTGAGAFWSDVPSSRCLCQAWERSLSRCTWRVDFLL